MRMATDPNPATDTHLTVAHLGQLALRAVAISIRFMVKPVNVDNNERNAAHLVASVVRGSPERYDRGDTPDKYDYNIVMPNASVIALEITRHTSQADHEFRGILNKEKKRHWRFPSLKNDRSIRINTPTDGKGVGKRVRDLLESLRRQVPALLEEVERTEPEPDLTFISPHGQVSDLKKNLRGLGITEVVLLGAAESQDGGMVEIVPRYPPTTAGDEIPAAAEQAINRKAAKLLRRAKDMGAYEAHLFVWLEHGPHSQPPVAVMAGGHCPERVPRLCGLDAVWVAIHDGDDPRKWGMWHCTCDDGWAFIDLSGS